MNKIIKNPFTCIQKFAVATLCIVVCSLFLFMSGCVDNNLNNDNEEQLITTMAELADAPFYYDFDKKIFLQQRKDKIFLKFAQDANTEQLHSLINRNSSLRPSIANLDETYRPRRVAVLESKDGKQIPSTTLESFKAMPEVLSVTYLLDYNGGLQGLMDDFVVKLMETTSYEQLEKLAAQNNCKIEEEYQFSFSKNDYFKISVSKASKLDAMQMSCLFYETGLFEYTSPNFAILNALASI